MREASTDSYSTQGATPRPGAVVADAVPRLVTGAPLDVTPTVEDRRADGIDGTPLVTNVRPLGADRPIGMRAVTAERSVGAAPGSRSVFAVVVVSPGRGAPPGVPCPPGARRFAFHVVSRTPSRAAGFGHARVDLVLTDDDTRGERSAVARAPAVTTAGGS